MTGAKLRSFAHFRLIRRDFYGFRTLNLGGNGILLTFEALFLM
jgi:hypothetical protein